MAVIRLPVGEGDDIRVPRYYNLGCQSALGNTRLRRTLICTNESYGQIGRRPSLPYQTSVGDGLCFRRLLVLPMENNAMGIRLIDDHSA